MGLSAAAFVLLIAVTGIMLNHSEDFDFDSRHVQTDWVLDRYGIEAPENLTSYLAGERQVTLMGNRLYLHRTRIMGDYRALHGASYIDGIFIIAADNRILLATPPGDIIERLKVEGTVSAGIERIGVDTSGGLVVQSPAGRYRADKDFIDWAQWSGDPASVQWARATSVGPELKASLQRQYRNDILPLERLLLDLHSGRFFGPPGPWLFDAAALLLILLSLSGTLIWVKRNR
jgi:hypothetical protein